jgi:type VI protein secretion system component VasK
MTNMYTTEFIKAVDHAAAMNDRWLFLAAFLLLLLLCGLVIYWLGKHLQAVIADHRALRDTSQAALAGIINAQNETALKLAVCIDRNTEALKECSFQLRRLQERSQRPNHD